MMCLCGCGKQTNKENKWIWHHNGSSCRKNWSPSQETRKKLSVALTGRKWTVEQNEKRRLSLIGHKSSLKGKTYEEILGKEKSEKFRNNLRQKRLGSNNPMYGLRGELSPSWLGGPKEYGIEFKLPLKETIRSRDNFKCIVCGKNQEDNKKKLDVHHIDYNKKNNSTDNLVSLCMTCHRKTNYNRKKWSAYFDDWKKSYYKHSLV